MHNSNTDSQVYYSPKSTSTHKEDKPIPLHVHVEQAIKNLLSELEGEPITGLYDTVLAQVEAPLFKVILNHSKTQIEAAKILGISRTTLNKKLKQYQYIES
jgi:Fis family transcriptional regulator